ncbi:hypothetical protein [Enterococcus faecium]|uniref:hypothetical protein n=1 Tax=Enterococcus faecium TaxID=1352 RepID=UPI001E5F56EF|nr:hypothetical protein [Enterococcus faecium]
MEKMITVTDLYKTFSGKKVIDGVSFTVDEGSIFALLGTNMVRGKQQSSRC